MTGEFNELMEIGRRELNNTYIKRKRNKEFVNFTILKIVHLLYSSLFISAFMLTSTVGIINFSVQWPNINVI